MAIGWLSAGQGILLFSSLPIDLFRLVADHAVISPHVFTHVQAQICVVCLYVNLHTCVYAPPVNYT